jgi:hypothetical protein
MLFPARLRDVGQDCLIMAEGLGLAYRENGRRHEALQLAETVVAAYKRTLGEEHPDTLDSMHNLALLEYALSLARHLAP